VSATGVEPVSTVAGDFAESVPPPPIENCEIVPEAYRLAT